MEGIQETLARLAERVNMERTELQDLEVDVGPMQEEIRYVDQVDETNQTVAT